MCRLQISHSNVTQNYLLCADDASACDHCGNSRRILHSLQLCSKLLTECRAHIPEFFGTTSNFTLLAYRETIILSPLKEFCILLLQVGASYTTFRFTCFKLLHFIIATIVACLCQFGTIWLPFLLSHKACKHFGMLYTFPQLRPLSLFHHVSSWHG